MKQLGYDLIFYLMFIEKKVIHSQARSNTFVTIYDGMSTSIYRSNNVYDVLSMGPVGSTSSNESIDDSKPPTTALLKKHWSWRLHCSPSSLVKESHTAARFTCRSTSKTINFIHQTHEICFFASSRRLFHPNNWK